MLVAALGRAAGEEPARDAPAAINIKSVCSLRGGGISVKSARPNQRFGSLLVARLLWKNDLQCRGTVLGKHM